MTLNQLTNFTDYLAHEWVLSEVETEDLLAFGATVAMCECEESTIRVHMEMRAEVLHLVGSEMQDFTDAFNRWKDRM